MKIATMVRILRGVFFPETCFHCGGQCPLDHNLPLCSRCLALVPLNRGPYCRFCGRTVAAGAASRHCSSRSHPADETFFVLRYEGLAKKIIQRYKINGDLRLGRLVRHLLRAFLAQRGLCLDYEWIVPIPPHRAPPARGRSPSKALAVIASRESGWPVRDLLRRRGPMKKQSSLTRTERIRNVRGAYRVTRAARLTGRRILLVDDVLTTGSTAAECARILKERGASRVGVLAGARGEAP